MTNLRRFAKATIHTGNQLGPPSPHVGERSHAEKVSSGTSKFPVGNAQKPCAFYVSNCKVNPIGGDGPIVVNWMGGKDNVESPRPRCKMDRNEENQRHSDFDYWRRSRPVCHYHWKCARLPCHRSQGNPLKFGKEYDSMMSDDNAMCMKKPVFWPIRCWRSHRLLGYVVTTQIRAAGHVI